MTEREEAAPEPEPRAKPVMVRVLSLLAGWLGDAANDNGEEAGDE